MDATYEPEANKKKEKKKRKLSEIELPSTSKHNLLPTHLLLRHSFTSSLHKKGGWIVHVKIKCLSSLVLKKIFNICYIIFA